MSGYRHIPRRLRACDRQYGVVLIILLWFIALVSVLVFSLSSGSRLSAKSTHHYRQQLEHWSATLDAAKRAEMELMLTRMPKPVEARNNLKQQRNPGYRFNGEPLTLSYPAPDHVTVHIYDHRGKINLRRLGRARFEQLLERFGVVDPGERAELLDAWEDWIDRDDMKRTNGAEKAFYAALDPPYEPRNAVIESVDELLLVRGMGRVVGTLDLHEIFTIHDNHSRINPNLATAATLALIPGIDESSAAHILEYRKEADIQGREQLLDILTPEQYRLASSWFDYTTGNYYTLAIVASPVQGVPGESDLQRAPPYAYQKTLLVRGYSSPPVGLGVRPFAPLPQAQD